MNNTNSNSMFQTVIQNIMNASRSTDNLCIIGEVGTGKRQAAASVHRASGKDEGRMSVVNCMALDHDNFLSDLFGRVTADGDLVRKGAVALADGGTLYLHEVHEISRESQAALVRFLETGTYRAVGSSTNFKANVRLIVSSSATLEALVESGKFRQDLLHFLTSIIIHMPRLNDRIEDIPTLFQSLVMQISEGANISVDEDALVRLKSHSYTGNLLELRNLALRSIATSQNNRITVHDVEGAIRGTAYFDLADQGVASNYAALAEQAGDAQYKAIAGTAAPKMLASGQVGVTSMPSEVTGNDNFDNLNSHVSMKEFTKEEEADGNEGSQSKTAKQVTNIEAQTVDDKEVIKPGVSPPNLKTVERQYLLDLIERFDGDKAEVAKAAGLNLRTLYRRLKALDID